MQGIGTWPNQDPLTRDIEWKRPFRQRMCTPFSRLLAANETFTFETQNPDVEMWVVAVSTNAGVEVRCSTGGGGGPYIDLDGGGKVKLPGNGNTFTVTNLTATPTKVYAVASVGFSFVDISPGTLA